MQLYMSKETKQIFEDSKKFLLMAATSESHLMISLILTRLYHAQVRHFNIEHSKTSRGQAVSPSNIVLVISNIVLKYRTLKYRTQVSYR